MKFEKAFHRIISKILHADPRLGPTQQYKIDPADSYMRVTLSTVAMTPFTFIASSHHTDSEPLTGMKVSLPIGVGPSCTFFEAVTEKNIDIVNNSWLDPLMSYLTD